MKRMDLPKNLPSIVRAAAERNARELAEAPGRKAQAFNVYQMHQWRSRHEKTQALLDGEATDIFDWAMMLQRDIVVPFGDLRDIFAHSPPLTVVSHEIDLPAGEDGLPGGRLTTTLELDFDDERFLNHYDRFDGYRVTGGGTLNTAYAIFTAIHPEMLRRIHALIAEGNVWDRIVHGLDKMFEDRKGR